MSGSSGQPRPCAGAALRIYDLFVNVEGVRVRVPKPLLGFIPFGVSRRFGFYAVIRLAAPESSAPALLLRLARAALAEEFAAISRSAPGAWHLRQIDRREGGAAAPTVRRPGCVEPDWGALWYELGDEAAKRDRYALARTRLWDEDFKVPRAAPAVPADVSASANRVIETP